MNHREEKSYWNSIKLMTISSVANSSYLTMSLMSNSNVNGWVNNNPISVSIQINDPRVNKSEKIKVNMYYTDLKDVMYKLEQQLTSPTINTTGGTVMFNSRLSKNTKSMTFRFTPTSGRLATSVILTDKASSFGRVELEIRYEDFRKLYMLLQQVCSNYVNLCSSFIQTCTNERMIESINNIGPSITNAIETSFGGMGSKIDELKTSLSSIETTISKLGVAQVPPQTMYNDMLKDSEPAFLSEHSLFDTTSDMGNVSIVDSTSDMLNNNDVEYFDTPDDVDTTEPNNVSTNELCKPADVINLGPLIDIKDFRSNNPTVVDLDVPFEYDELNEDVNPKKERVLGRKGSDGLFYGQIDSSTPIEWFNVTRVITKGTCDASFEPLAMPLNFLGMSKYIDDFRKDPEYFNQQYSILHDFKKMFKDKELHNSNTYPLCLPYEYTFKVDDTHELYNTLVMSGIINSAYFILSKTYDAISQYNETISIYNTGRHYTHRIFLSLFASIDFTKINEDKLKNDIRNAFIDMDNRGFFNKMLNDYSEVTSGGKLRIDADLVINHLLAVVAAIQEGKFLSHKNMVDIFKQSDIPYHILHSPSEVKAKCVSELFIEKKNNNGIDPRLHLYLKCVKSVANKNEETDKYVEDISKYCKTFEELGEYMSRVSHPKSFARMKVVMDMNSTIDRKSILVDKYKGTMDDKFVDSSKYTFMKELSKVDEDEMNSALFGFKK